ncbi:hypothetical protein CKY47_29085 [Saccharothrix yanglingensis]|uniref:Uncharacterized protein n=1 Tax=Saccharothrix yanglingensis TaxID=659496 RepID=A0ABU0XBA9_9PSEU|nr:hypothetical protein [Saccharothrix yanglingensis]
MCLAERAEGAEQFPLEPPQVADVDPAALVALGLLQLRAPQEVLGPRVPAQVDLVQRPVVGEHDDLGGQLVTRGGRGRAPERLEQSCAAHFGTPHDDSVDHDRTGRSHSRAVPPYVADRSSAV